MQAQPESIIADLELAVRSGSSDKRVTALRQVADLFLHDLDRLNDEQVKVFDTVLCLLASRIESKALAELSERLAPVDNAPIEVIRRLARDDEIGVAGPVLSESTRLTTKDLSDIARTQGDAHLLAISGRERLDEAVTDVLVERGNREVFHKLAGNSGARLSESGYGALVQKAEGDDALAEKVGQRIDIPAHLHRQLILRATEAVRAKLLPLASPQARDEISRVLAKATDVVAAETEKPRQNSRPNTLSASCTARENSTTPRSELCQARQVRRSHRGCCGVVLGAAERNFRADHGRAERRRAAAVQSRRPRVGNRGDYSAQPARQRGAVIEDNRSCAQRFREIVNCDGAKNPAVYAGPYHRAQITDLRRLRERRRLRQPQ